jgi:hypothetical protein
MMITLSLSFCIKYKNTGWKYIMLQHLFACLPRHDVLLFHFRGSSEDDDYQGPQTSIRNRKQRGKFMKRHSKRRHAEDVESAYLLSPETQDVERERSDSELSYSYQYETNDEPDTVETPMVTEQPTRDDDNSNAGDAESGFLLFNETGDVRRRRPNTDPSHSHQYDADDELDATQTPTVTQEQDMHEPAYSEEDEDK